MISFEDGQELLKLARQALSFHFTEKPITILNEQPLCELKEAVFVTLYKDQTIRGRIGTFKPTKSLCTSIKEFVYAAAFDDPRYESISKDEYQQVKISLAFLSRIEKIDHSDEQIIESEIEKFRTEQNIGILLSHKHHFSMILPEIIAKDNLDTKSILMRILEDAEMSLEELTQDEETTLVLFHAQEFKEE